MKITPCKKAKKPSLPPAMTAPSDREILQHLGGECYPIVNDSFKCEAANWLKARHKDTAWLEEQCGVTKKTVERWLMPWTRIPAARMLSTRGAGANQTAKRVCPAG